MQTVSEVMSRNAQAVAPGEPIQRAAQLMGSLNVGALPVCDGERLVGMVTDRDIAVRGMAAGKAPQSAHVDEVMTAEVRWCFEDQPVDDVVALMAGSLVRRIPVVSHDDQHKLVGIVSLGDLATKAGGEADVGQVVEKVSAPSDTSGPAPAAPAGPAAGAARKTESGVLEAMTGIDQRTSGEQLVGVAGATGQQRVDPAGEPLRTSGGVDPQQASSLGKDRDDTSPPSPEANAV
ncbi:MAG: CBS domain-containing protein [Massilia sp.]